MRIKNTIKNMKISFIFFFITMILNFVSRAIFIKYLGVNITGYSNLVNSLLGFLNMAEMGIASAIGYSLYEPLKNKDNDRISEIMTLFKHLYSRIGIVVLILGVILSFSIPLFIKGQISIKEGFIYYYLLLLSNGISYFFTYKQTLIISDQKQYIVTVISSIIKIIKVIVQILLLSISKNYLIWILVEVIFSFFTYRVINKKVENIYHDINFNLEITFKKLTIENKNIIKNIKDIFFHKISSFVVYQTDSIVISAFSTLRETAIYSNYMMIINNIISLISAVTGSITASVGNLVSEKNSKKNYDTFRKLHLVDNLMALFICSILYNIINFFIGVWLGEEFIFKTNIVIVLLINLYFQISRGTIVKFKTAFGLFWDIWAPMIEGVINLIISIILVRQIGIIGVFIGTLFSNIIIIVIWHPIIVFKYGFNENVSKYYIYTIKIILLGSISIICANNIIRLLDLNNILNGEIIGFLIYSLSVTIINSLTFLISFVFMKEFRALIKIILQSVILNKKFLFKLEN